MLTPELDIIKYPSTPHVGDSCLQHGDDPSKRIDFSRLSGRRVVYEEKIDGGNSGFRFDAGGSLWMQSRGRFLNAHDRNAPRERDWSLMKDWLVAHEGEFLDRFEDRYAVYGEWAWILHSIFYNALPHFFLEFDVYDTFERCFLDTPSRRRLLEGLPIVSVPVLYEGPAVSLDHLKSFVRPSLYRTPIEVSDWREDLRRACDLVGDDYERRLAKLDHSDLSEGIYGKVEENGRIVERFKWVRSGFVQTILDADEHWQSRFLVPNLLADRMDVFPSHLARGR